MTLQRLATAIVLLLAACSEDLGIEDHLFRCSADQDCVAPLRCHPTERLCLPADHDAGVKPFDAGFVTDSGPSCSDPDPIYDPCQRAGRTSSSALSAWWFCTELSATQVDTTTRARSASIEDLAIGASRSSVTYDVTMVSFPRASRISTALFSASLDDIDRLVCARTATTTPCRPRWRIVDAEPVQPNRTWAAVFVPWVNTSWWWYTGTTAATLENALDRSSSRLLDLQVARPSSAAYLVVAISNSGPSQRESRFAINVPREEFATLQSEGETYSSVTPENESGTHFAVVLDRCATCSGEGLIDRDALSIDRYARKHGLRVSRVAGYGTSSDRRYAAVLVEDLRPPATTARDLLRGVNQGRYGFSIGVPGGSALAALGEHDVFEPGAAIATLLLLYGYKEIELGRARLEDSIPIYTDGAGGCAIATSTASETLDQTLGGAARGDVRRIQALIDRFTPEKIVDFATGIGLRATSIEGCAKSRTSLADLTAVQRAITSSAALSSASREAIDARFNDEPLRSRVEVMVQAHAAAEALDAAAIADYSSRVKIGAIASRHPSSRSDCAPEESAAIAGRIELPFCLFGALVQSHYAFGAFLEDVTIDAAGPVQNASDALLDQLLRNSVRAYAACSR